MTLPCNLEPQHGYELERGSQELRPLGCLYMVWCRLPLQLYVRLPSMLPQALKPMDCYYPLLSLKHTPAAQPAPLPMLPLSPHACPLLPNRSMARC